MNNINDFFGMDFEWYAKDSINQIAFFTSAGELYFPKVFINNSQSRDKSWKFLNQFPKTTNCIKCKDYGKMQDWINAAESGFYGYDFDIHGKQNCHALICKPEIPTFFLNSIENIELPYYHGKFGISTIEKNEVVNWEMK